MERTLYRYQCLWDLEDFLVSDEYLKQSFLITIVLEFLCAWEDENLIGFHLSHIRLITSNSYLQIPKHHKHHSLIFFPLPSMVFLNLFPKLPPNLFNPTPSPLLHC